VTAARPLRVGLVGCGDVTQYYVGNAHRFDGFELVACADADRSRSRALAGAHGLEALAVDDLLDRDDLDVVLNLTPPGAHAELTLAAIARGRHVYSEKPLATSLAAAREIGAAAAAAGVTVCCAPDTTLGAGFQTALRLLRGGGIGTPTAVAMAVQTGGPESFHHRPQRFHQPGAGPLFDFGPYYLTALVRLLGAVTRVTAIARSAWPERAVRVGPDAGSRFAVTTPSHVAGVLELAGGQVATLTASFDAPRGRHSTFVVEGDEGVLHVPDPNRYGDPAGLLDHDGTLRPEPPAPGPTVESRGVGLDDLARALREDREPVASLAVAVHVVEVMEALLAAAASGSHRTIAPPGADLRLSPGPAA
jgi:predicted dehydrogenase